MTTHEETLTRPLFTVDTLAAYLSISRVTIYRMVKEGKLRPVRVSKRMRFLPDEIDSYLESQRVRP